MPGLKTLKLKKKKLNQQQQLNLRKQKQNAFTSLPRNKIKLISTKSDSKQI